MVLVVIKEVLGVLCVVKWFLWVLQGFSWSLKIVVVEFI